MSAIRVVLRLSALRAAHMEADSQTSEMSVVIVSLDPVWRLLYMFPLATERDELSKPRLLEPTNCEISRPTSFFRSSQGKRDNSHAVQ